MNSKSIQTSHVDMLAAQFVNENPGMDAALMALGAYRWMLAEEGLCAPCAAYANDDHML